MSSAFYRNTKDGPIPQNLFLEVYILEPTVQVSYYKHYAFMHLSLARSSA